MPIKNAIHSQKVYDPTNAMLSACVFLFVKNAPAVHQV